MLRRWQSECIEVALGQYQAGQAHFFCQATPGAGKTIMAAQLANRLIESDKVDLVLCFSPSLTVSKGVASTFSRILGCPFNGGLGAIGASYTYQSIRFIDDSFWSAVQKYRLFVVFDEIHHCSGGDDASSNAWGEQVLTKLQNIAKYTLALSGTPWRSDAVPIAMAKYTDPDGELVCDYTYSLRSAVEELVCRAPKIVLVDNEHLSVSEGVETKSFSSILDLLKFSNVSYQSVIHNDNAMAYLLELGCRKLAQIRKDSPNAGGLVVAASVNHAKQIQSFLINQFGQSASIVTYRHENPLEEIESFRQSDTQWIVSVGMISEGTDIPRLQVCCHMSAVKTELYFRQVLGRILRVNDSPNQEAWLLTFAEENLVGFAERIEQDLPETCRFVKFGEVAITIKNEAESVRINVAGEPNHIDLAGSLISWGRSNIEGYMPERNKKEIIDELRMGRFKERVIAAFC